MDIKNREYQRDFFLQLPGLLLICSLITAAISGLLIAAYYIPTLLKAALSIRNIQEQVFAGAVVIAVHRISGMLAVLFTFLNLIIIISVKKTTDTSIKIWQSGIILLILLVTLQVAGYILSGSSSAVYLLKSILKIFFNCKSQIPVLPLLSAPFSFAFIRIYLLHVIIFPVLTGFVLYKHIKNVKQFHADLHPVTIPPITLYAIFATIVIISALFSGTAAEPISSYAVNYFSHMPWSIRFLVFIKQSFSVPIIIIICIVLFLFIWFFGNILRKIRT